MTSTPTGPFRVGVVPGVTPDTWARRWRQRQRSPLELVLLDLEEAVSAVRDHRVSMGFVRDAEREEGLHRIVLYEEVPVVVAPREHPVSVYDEVDLADLAGEALLDASGAEAGWVTDVLAGLGVAVVPMSLARVHARKDLVAVPVRDSPGSTVALFWRVEDEDPRVEAFVGIVRGRTENSTRGAGEPQGAPARGSTQKPTQKPDRRPKPAGPRSGARTTRRPPRPGSPRRGRR